MNIFDQLQALPLSDFIASSEWGYPILLSVHSIGLAIVVGLVAMLDLRVLGAAKGVPISAFPKLLNVAWYGFGVNAISGLLLLLPGGMRLASCWPFLLKMAAIALGGVVATYMVRELNFQSYAGAAGSGEGNVEPEITQRARVLAIVSLACWLVAIIAGRLIAYVVDASILEGN